MISPELLATLGTGLVSTVTVVATVRADIRWLKRWTRDHEAIDTQRHTDNTGRLDDLTNAMLKSPR